MPPALMSVARVFQRRDEIFRALALEFFLSGFEVGHARGDFFALSRKAVLLFGHAHPFFDSCPALIGGAGLGRHLGLGVAGLWWRALTVDKAAGRLAGRAIVSAAKNFWEYFR
jgi:hypothetical protein